MTMLPNTGACCPFCNALATSSRCPRCGAVKMRRREIAMYGVVMQLLYTTLIVGYGVLPLYAHVLGRGTRPLTLLANLELVFEVTAYLAIGWIGLRWARRFFGAGLNETVWIRRN